MLDRLVEKSSVEFVRFLKLLLAPQKQNRYTTSKDALNALDQDESRIFISIPHAKPKIKHQKTLIKGAAVLLGALTVLFFVFSVISNNRNNTQPQPTVLPDTSAYSQPESIQQSQKMKEREIPQTTAVLLSKDSGTVLLTSMPWAKVYVDNAFIGETPISKPIVLSAGKHSVTFMHPSFDPILRNITVQPNKETHVFADFIAKSGFINCIVNPWAEVFVDEQYKGTTPLEKPILISTGKHQVRFKNTSFADVIREVTIKSKDTVTLHIFFEKQ